MKFIYVPRHEPFLPHSTFWKTVAGVLEEVSLEVDRKKNRRKTKTANLHAFDVHGFRDEALRACIHLEPTK